MDQVPTSVLDACNTSFYALRGMKVPPEFIELLEATVPSGECFAGPYTGNLTKAHLRGDLPPRPKIDV